jgi:hypothetical protein
MTIVRGRLGKFSPAYAGKTMRHAAIENKVENIDATFMKGSS